jgi:hypothetical protein
VSDPVGPLDVTGGVGGIDARYDDVERLATLHDVLGTRLRDAARDDALLVLDGDLLASAVLAPHTFLAAEAAVLAATDGPRGLLAGAVEVEARALVLGSVVTSYRAADEAQRSVLAALQYALGFTIGRNLLPVGGGALAAGGGLVVLRDTRPGLADRIEHDLVALVEQHPETVELLAGTGGGLLDGLATTSVGGPVLALLGVRGFHPDTAAAARELGRLLYADQRGEIDPAYDRRIVHDPPHAVADLLTHLDATSDGEPGVITVQRLGGDDPRWVVHLPGTDSFTDPGAIRGMAANLELLAGDDTAYAEAVRAALRDAGVGADEPVLVTGHSQGGMQAAALAADPELGFTVTHLVTVGAPIATTDVPDDVAVLSLENTADAVPLLEGAPNRGGPRHVTVSTEVATGDLAVNHGLAVYGRIADAVDRSDDPSVQAAVRSLADGGFLVDRAVESQTFTFRTRLAAPSQLPLKP